VATESSIQFRRLSDLLSEIQLLEAQLQVLREDAGPHLIRDIGLRLAALHGRLNQTEHRLRVHARDLNEDDQAAISHIRTRLTALQDRRQKIALDRPGQERRQAPRRRGDKALPQSRDRTG